MTTNIVRPCRFLNPSECPCHGAMIKMDDALASGDFNAYTAARAAFDIAADAKKHAVFTAPTEAPAGASYEYAGARMTNESGVVLYQIRAKRNIPSVGVRKGDLEGWVDPTPPSKRKRISGNAWVGGNAQVYGDAHVSAQGEIRGNAKIFGSTIVSDYAQVEGDAQISGKAMILGYVKISGDVIVTQGIHSKKTRAIE